MVQLNYQFFAEMLSFNPERNNLEVDKVDWTQSFCVNNTLVLILASYKKFFIWIKVTRTLYELFIKGFKTKK